MYACNIHNIIYLYILFSKLDILLALARIDIICISTRHIIYIVSRLRMIVPKIMLSSGDSTDQACGGPQKTHLFFKYFFFFQKNKGQKTVFFLLLLQKLSLFYMF